MNQLHEWEEDERSEVGGLIVSELAPNAIRHARSGFEVQLNHTEDSVGIAVKDESFARPVLREVTPDFPSGRGLQIVAALATDWGFELSDQGKEGGLASPASATRSVPVHAGALGQDPQSLERPRSPTGVPALR